jgi:hydroxymethylpyrimidine/phosphomethylpyrimidine kinase
VTPNLAELSALTGLEVSRRDHLPLAAQALQTLVQEGNQGAKLGLFATGGHLDPPDDFLLTPSGEALWLPGTHIATRATHGTGCALSSAFLSRLVLGDTPAEAAEAAKRYVATALKSAIPRGAGASSINHLWGLYDPKD